MLSSLGQPTKFRGVSKNSNSITLRWKPFQNTSGMIILQYSNPRSGVFNYLLNSSLTTITLGGFMPYTTWQFSLYTTAFISVGATTFVTTQQGGEYSIFLKSTIIFYCSSQWAATNLDVFNHFSYNNPFLVSSSPLAT